MQLLTGPTCPLEPDTPPSVADTRTQGVARPEASGRSWNDSHPMPPNSGSHCMGCCHFCELLPVCWTGSWASRAAFSNSTGRIAVGGVSSHWDRDQKEQTVRSRESGESGPIHPLGPDSPFPSIRKYVVRAEKTSDLWIPSLVRYPRRSRSSPTDVIPRSHQSYGFRVSDLGSSGSLAVTASTEIPSATARAANFSRVSLAH